MHIWRRRPRQIGNGLVTTVCWLVKDTWQTKRKKTFPVRRHRLRRPSACSPDRVGVEARQKNTRSSQDIKETDGKSSSFTSNYLQESTQNERRAREIERGFVVGVHGSAQLVYLSRVYNIFQTAEPCRSHKINIQPFQALSLQHLVDTKR